MFGSAGAIDRYRQEYCLYRAIRENNDNAAEIGETSSIVYTTQGRAVSERVFARRDELIAAGAASSDAAFVQAVNEALGDQWSSPPFGDARNGDFATYSNEFAAITGFAPGGTQTRPDRTDDEHAIPISPFDSRFATRESVWNAGSEMLYVTVSSADARGLPLDDLDKGYHTRGMRLQRRNRKQNPETGDWESEWADKGRLYGPADLSGLSAVRPYMGRDEYRKVSAHISQSYGGYFAFDPVTGSYPDVVTSSRGKQVRFDWAERDGRVSAGIAAAVMRDRISKGREFEVRAERLGQVELVDDLSRMAIRLFDEPGEAYWVGRIRDIQTGTYYRWQLSTSAMSRSHDHVPDRWRTGGMAVRAFSWACGEDVWMRDLDLNPMRVGDPSFELRYGPDARVRANHTKMMKRDANGGIVYKEDGSPDTVDVVDTDHFTGAPRFSGDFRQHANCITTKDTMSVSIGWSRVSPRVVGDVLEDGTPYAARLEFDADPQGDVAALQLYGDYSGWTADFTLFQQHGNGEGAKRAAERAARNYIRDAVEQARQELFDEIDVDALVESAKHAVRNEDDDLDLAEGCTTQEVFELRDELLGMLIGTVPIEGYDGDERPEPWTPEFVADAETYVRDAVSKFVDERVGEYTEMEIGDETVVGGTFDIIGVSRYKVSESEGRVRDTLVRAMRRAGMSPLDFEGRDDDGNLRLADRLVQFQEDNAVTLANLNDPAWMAARAARTSHPESWEFRKKAMETVRDALRSSVCSVSDDEVAIDANGIIRYTAHRAVGALQERADGTAPWGDMAKVGEVGPIFERTERGTFVTGFAASDNYELVPKVRGYMVPPSGNGEERYERLRGVTFEDEFLARLRSQVCLDIRRAKGTFTDVGTPWSMAKAWRSGDHERLPLDHDEKVAAHRMDPEVDAARIEAMRSTVGFGSKVGREAGIIQHLRHLNSYDPGMRYNDNPDDLYYRYGFMGVADAAGDGIFDPAWPSSAGSQAHQRVLRPGAELHPDRPPTRVEPSEENTLALNRLDISKYSQYDSWARRVMFLQNLMSALCVTEPVGVALTSFGGWTTEDGVVISSDFANAYMVDDGNGGMRPLVPGDKISDCHGNKGVVGLVVDRNWSAEEALERGLTKEWTVFRDNPELDVAMTLFSLLSRINAGTIREAVGRGDAVDLVANGGEIPGGIGHMVMLVHDKTAESKVSEGDHHAGWQATGVLYALECYGVLEDVYGVGGFGESRLSEVLMATMGAQLSEDLDIVPFDPSSTSPLDLPDMDEFFAGNGKKDMKRAFLRNLEVEGGVLELPCELRFPSFPPVQFAEGEVPEDLKDMVTPRRIGRETVYELQFGGQPLPKVEGIWDAGDDRTCEGWHAVSEGTWALPVLSRPMREGSTTVDGITVHHNFTKSYATIYKSALEYVKAKMDGDEVLMEKMRNTMQRHVDSIGNELCSRCLDGKWNVAKSEMLTRDIKGSPYAVWSGNPTAALDEIRVSPNLMKAMRLSDGDTVMVMRHPVLKEGCAVSLTVRCDETLHGLAVNPSVAGIIGGDFDGDQVVVWKPATDAAVQEAKDRLNVGEYLLNRGKVDEKGKHPLALGVGADVASALYRKPELADKVREVVDRLNELDGMERGPERSAGLQEAVSDLNGILADALSDEYCESVISFTDIGSALQSVLDTSIAKGVKGSVSKFADFCKAVGVEVELEPVDGDETGANWRIVGLEDKGRTLLSRADDESVMCATTAKQDYTGVSGKEMQFAIAAFEEDPEVMRAALRIVEKLYQKTLDWKHSGQEAMDEAPYIDIAKSALNARFIDVDDDGKTLRDESGEELVGVDAERYVSQLEWCLDMLGQDYNVDDLKLMAGALAGPDGICDGMRDRAVADASFVLRCAMSEDSKEFATAFARGEHVYGPDGGMMSKLQPTGVHRHMNFSLAKASAPAPEAEAATAQAQPAPAIPIVGALEPVAAEAVAAEEMEASENEEFKPMKVDRSKLAGPAAAKWEEAPAVAAEGGQVSLADRVRMLSKGVARRSAPAPQPAVDDGGDGFVPMKVDRSKIPVVRPLSPDGGSGPADKGNRGNAGLSDEAGEPAMAVSASTGIGGVGDGLE